MLQAMRRAIETKPERLPVVASNSALEPGTQGAMKRMLPRGFEYVADLTFPMIRNRHFASKAGNDPVSIHAAAGRHAGRFQVDARPDRCSIGAGQKRVRLPRPAGLKGGRKHHFR